MRTDVPLDVELEIAMWIPDFLTLHSFILVARTYNQLFSAHHVLRLVNTLKAVGYRRRPREANNYEDHEYKSTFIRQLLRCEETVNDIHLPVFKTLVTGGVKWLETPSVTERTRIIRAAYRFWTYCCIDEDYAGSFFSKFNTLEVLEMAQFEAALETWVDGMWGDTECLDDYHYDKICGVVSCGLGTISEIWGLFRTLVIPDKNDAGDIYGLF
ncbi:hypothetical protein C8J57DRAFT_1545517 [Mycena rebaudengoi]|nr:hypothetical protein C8J57DRAFT_1545517 [Mycena rebaudengoi]